jgi:hypothetical protein
MGKMSKKGQFYIFASVVLLTYAFFIMRAPVLGTPETSAFESLYENFLSESPVVINNAIYKSANLSETYGEFVDSFLSFSKTKDPNFRLVYLLAEHDSLVIGNRLDMEINATIGSTSYALPPNSQITIQKPDDVAIAIGRKAYQFSFGSEDTQVKAIFRRADKKETRVSVHVLEPSPTKEASKMALSLPAQLFDIKLELENSLLPDSTNLVAWVTFESFGREETPVDLKFIVLDSLGNELYSKTDNLTVFTERVVVEHFEDFKSGSGNYSLILRTSYGANVSDEFRQTFQVMKAQKRSLNPLPWIILVGILLLLLNYQWSHKEAVRATLLLLAFTIVALALSIFFTLHIFLVILFSIAVAADVLFMYSLHKAGKRNKVQR